MVGQAGTVNAAGALDAGLLCLVRLSRELALGVEGDVAGMLGHARKVSDPVEVEEALLQSYLFLGYPTALNALGLWRRLSGRAAPDPEPELGADDWQGWSERGREVCRAVYAGQYEGLRQNIRSLSPEMECWMVTEGYGKVLGRPGLTLFRRECCIVAILAASGAQSQLYSHLRGALQTGGEIAQVEEALEIALEGLPGSRRMAARGTWDNLKQRVV